MHVARAGDGEQDERLGLPPAVPWAIDLEAHRWPADTTRFAIGETFAPGQARGSGAVTF